MLQHVSVYINHHQGANSPYFTKVRMLISVTQDVIRYVGNMAAYYSVLLKVCYVHCTVSFRTVHVTHCQQD
jgi:hypothetical protein